MSGADGRRCVVVKVGSSSVTTKDGQTDEALVGRISGEIAAVLAGGVAVVLVT